MDSRIKDPITTLFSRSVRRKVKFEEVDHAVAKQLPGYSGMERDQAIIETLKHLEAMGELKLPARNKNGWNPLTNQPRYLILVRPREDAEKKARTKEIAALRERTPWEPVRMAEFAHALNTKKQLELARGVNDYLLSRKTNETAIPHRERALKIFGNEKALDPYVKTGLFSDRITLQDLDCFYCPEPFPYEVYSFDPKNTRGRPLLLVENSATYWSCCRANRSNHTSGGGFFAAVIFGKGFKTANDHQILVGLRQIENQTQSSKIFYFGDLDPAGLNIPQKINETRISSGLAPIFPAIPLYRALLDKNIKTEYQRNQEQYHDPKWAENWLGTELAGPYLQFCHISRWPQEGLTASDIGQAMSILSDKICCTK